MKSIMGITSSKIFTPVLVVVLLAAFALPAAGQLAISTSLTGRVTDSSGAVVPGASVKAINTATGVAYMGATGPSGIYKILYIPVGTYSITVTAKGFKTVTHSHIIVTNNQTVRSNYVLQVGAIATKVTVTGTPPPIATDNPTISQTISQRSIAQLPVNGADPLKLAALNSSVMLNRDNPRGNPPGERFQGAGTRQIQNDVTLDGVTTMNALYMTDNLRPDPAAVQELNVVTGTYGAQYGNYLGVHINEVTKGGTNHLHGALSEFVGNTKFNANSYDFSAAPIAKEPYHFNQFNAEVGGPVVIPGVYNGKDKTFFMFDYQGLRNIQTPSRTYTVMTPLMRTGDFTELSSRATLTDIYNPSCVSGNVIAPGCVSTVAQQFLKVIPTPNVKDNSTASGYALTNNLVVPVGLTSNFDQYLTREDENIGTKTRFYFRYAYQKGSASTGGPLPTFFSYAPNTQTNFVVDYTQILSPNIVNDVHLGRNDISVVAANAYYQDPSLRPTAQALNALIGPVNGTNLFAYQPDNPGAVGMSISGYTGSSGGGTWWQTDTAWLFSDSLSVIHGAHTMTIGADLDRFLTTRRAVNNPEGNFSFSGGITTPGSSVGAPADFMLGLPQQVYTPAPEVNGSGLQWRDGFYFEDKWDTTPKLTLSIGLRYGLFTVPVSPTGYATTLNATQTALIPTPADIPAPYYPLTQPWHKGWAPRFGFAYRVTNAWVVRGGFGMFYNPNQTNSYTLLDTNPPMSSASIYNTSPSAQLSFADPSGGSATPASGCLYNGIPICGNTVSAKSLNSYMPPGTMEQWSIDLERTLWSNAGLDIQYLGNHAYHLDTSYYSNTPMPSTTPFVAAARPNQNFGSIRILDNMAYSHYKGFNIVLTQRFQRGLILHASYTWSHFQDVSVDSNDGGQPMDPLNWALDYSNSSLDVRQRFVTGVDYQLPFLSGSTGLLRTVAAGWNVDGIFEARSGLPFNVTISGDPANTGRTGQERPQLIGTPNNQCGSVLIGCITNAASAFATPALGTYGTTPRNMLYGPRLVVLDFSLQKDFRIHEGADLQLRGEAFNIANHPSFGNPASRFGALSFGNITSLTGANPTRVIQLMARLTF